MGDTCLISVISERVHELTQAVDEYTGWPKILAQFLYALTLPNINRFSKLFHCQNQEKICNEDPTTPQLCCYTTL